MSSKINQLTAEQIYLIPDHAKKWENIAISTKRLDRNRAEQIIYSTYELIGYKPPIILFFDSPFSVYHFVLNQTEQQLKALFGEDFSQPDYEINKWLKTISKKVSTQIDFGSIYAQIERINSVQQLDLRSGIGTYNGIDFSVDPYIWSKFSQLELNKVHKYIGTSSPYSIRPNATIANTICQLDYYISNCNLTLDCDKWNRFKLLFQLGNYIYPRQKLCIVCERPSHLHFDSRYRLHAEGELAIHFADGTGLYSYHGRTLPDKYGRIHPSQWQVKWLLEETNPELRSALVMGLGYNKINRQLSVTNVDRWQNYLLIRINVAGNLVLCYLLQTIHDIGIKYAIEIPYNLPTVKQAAGSINWDIFATEPVYSEHYEELDETSIPF